MAYECAKQELSLFEPKAVQYSILKTEQVVLKPLASIEKSNIIQFLHQGYSDEYKSLSSAYVVLKVKLNHYDATGKEMSGVIDTHEKLTCSIANNTLHSLIRQVNLTLNGREISKNSNNYAYRSYIENLLNYDDKSSGQHLDGVIFKLDIAKHFDDLAGSNTASGDRGLLFQPGNPVELVGRLHLDMFNCPKLLLNNIDVGITIELNSPNFYLRKVDAENKSNLELLDATLYMDQVKINPEVALSIERLLETKNAVYNYKRIEVRNFLLQKDVSSFNIDNVSNGVLPELVVFAMTETKAYLGDSSKNPFAFKHFDLTKFSASVNGIEIAPRNLSFDFSKEMNPLSQHAYFSLFKQMRLHQFDRSNLITRNLYNNGCMLIGFDLTPDRGGECGNIGQTGSLRFEGTFAKVLPETVTALVYMQFDADLIVDKDRNIYLQ